MRVEMTFGEWLKRRRRQLDLTQKELARRVSCSEGTIRKMESNLRRPSTQLAQLIAIHLEIPPPQQPAFITFARSEAYMADMDKALAAMGEDSSELSPLPLLSVVWPETAPASQSVLTAHNLPLQPTPFVGRSAELAALNALLANPDTRLITIVGPGGIGKTRLALACGEQQITADSPFPDGVFFVNLAPLGEAEQLIPALADALNFPLRRQDGRSPQQQILDYLRQKKMLLIMDNFEHLLSPPTSPPVGGTVGGVDLVTAIWRAAANVRVLVTSRERLHLQAEQVFQIGGLDFPQWESVVDAETYTAIQFFLQCAHRNQFNFALQDEDDLNSLGRICRLVAGMPLAIELAASWVDKLSLADIATELQQGMDLLATDMRDMPDRHRSVRAAFDHSWQMLEKMEQDVFAQLSVFRGGCTSRAAQEVTGANLRILSRLVNKSFLQYDQLHRRYQVHELMRQFGAEKLAQNEESQAVARGRHSDFYCHALQQWEAGLKSARQPTIRSEIEADYRNIQSAWDYALAQKNLAQLLMAVKGLGRFFEVSGRSLEGMDTFEKSAARLQADNGDIFNTAAMRLLIWLPAWQVNLLLETHLPLSSFVSYEQLLQRALAVLEQLKVREIDTRDEEAFIHLQFGALLLQGTPDNLPMVQENLSISQRLYQSLNDLTGIADTLYWYHIYARGMGLLTQAYSYIQDNLALLRPIGEPRRLVRSLMRAGVISSVLLASDEAVAYFDQAYLMAQAVGDGLGMCEVRFAAAFHVSGRGQFDLALHYFYEALSLAQNDNNTPLMALAMAKIGWTQLFLGQPLQALAQLEKALALFPDLRIVDVPALQLFARLHAGHYGLIQPFDETNENVEYLLGWGWVALTNGNDAEALALAQKACRQGDILSPREFQAQSQSLSGLALLRLGRKNEAKRELFQSLQSCLEIGYFQPLMELIPIICLVLAGEADIRLKERGIKLYALAENLPHVGNSRLFSDLMGRPIKSVEATLSSPVGATAQAKEGELDWWQTAESLLTELTELGWAERAG